MKISKKALKYLGIGVYVIALAVSGYMLFGKLDEQSKVEEELTLAKDKLEMTDAERLSGQIAELEVQLAQITSESEILRDMMSEEKSQVVASTITFEVAGKNYVEVLDLNSKSSFSEVLENLPCDIVPIEAIVEGNVEDIVNFVIQLNTTITTGVIKSVNLNIPEVGTGVKPTATISLLIYNYQDY
ncbi:MAG: hypothetical protein JSU79_02035 [Dehalococcoidales bacterium]|nr:MAG: hypothetical protein JSU79_02035 [Dehalococcoidales bacterium]